MLPDAFLITRQMEKKICFYLLLYTKIYLMPLLWLLERNQQLGNMNEHVDDAIWINIILSVDFQALSILHTLMR